jgi:prophage DNA circulation protein
MLRDPSSMADDVEAAARRLLDAAGDEGHLGYVTRHPVTGELEVVVAARGSNARDVLATVRRRSRLASLVRSFAGRS